MLARPKMMVEFGNSYYMSCDQSIFTSLFLITLIPNTQRFLRFNKVSHICRLYEYIAASNQLEPTCLHDMDVAKGGRKGCAPPPPWGFRDPAGRRSARAKTPAEATETLTEVRKSVRKPTKKHVRAVGTPLIIWARQKNKAPVTIRGQVTAKVIISDPSEYQGPSQLSGAL